MANNYPFHGHTHNGASERSLLIMSMQKQARENARKRYWRNVGWLVVMAVGTIAFTVFFYSRITV